MIEILEQKSRKDTTINSFMMYENYKDYYALFLGRYMDESVYRCLLEFQLPVLIGKGIVEKVELLLYVTRNDYENISKEFQVCRIKQSFDENKVNFQNQPAIDEKIYGTFYINNEIDAYINIDITKLFSDWYTEKHPNYGLLLKASNEKENNLVAFCSNGLSNNLHSPKIKIYYKKIDQEKNNDIDYEDIYINDKIYEENDPKNMIKIVKALEKKKEYDKALYFIEKFIRYYPDFTDLIYTKGKIFKNKKKNLLAIDIFKKCIDIGEGPLVLNFITGTGTFKAYEELADLYFQLEDDEKAYFYCTKALEYNRKSIHNLCLLYKIFLRQNREMVDIQYRLEEYLGDDLHGENYILLGKVFLNEKNYEIAYNYFKEAEQILKDSSIIFYDQGICLLFLKKYDKAYDYFKKVKNKEQKKEAIYKMFLCKALDNNIYEGSKILENLRNPENNLKYSIYDSLRRVLTDQECYRFNKEQSEKGIEIIFEILEVLLAVKSPEIFEKSLKLLNIVENEEVLLRLAKLYYSYGFYEMAYKEFIRSIKIFDKIDTEGMEQMKKILLKIK